MDLKLAGKSAIISGGASGIGTAIAHGFLAEGARVAITSRRPEALETARTELLKTGGEDDILTIHADVSTSDGAADAVQQAIAHFGVIDSAVANAGAGSYPTGWDISPENWQDAISANLLTGVNLITAGIPYLIKSRGTAVFVSSIAALEALPAPIPYSAAKTALHGVAKGLADDVAKHGVRVNVVSPGNVIFPGGNWDKKMNDPSRKDAVAAYIEDHVPLQRFGRPEEIADAVLFLSSPRAGFVTGTNLTVDGGQARAVK